MIQIVKVECPRCHRRFRTILSVLEHRAPVMCPKCGKRMQVSKPQSVAVLAKIQRKP